MDKEDFFKTTEYFFLDNRGTDICMVPVNRLIFFKKLERFAPYGEIVEQPILENL